jgi:hypothetical protein
MLENIMNWGIITTGYGIITEAKSIMKRLFLPGNLSFAKANAAILEVKVPITVTVTATIKLLVIPESNGPISQISAYLLNDMVSGIQTGGNANTSSFVLTEVENIQSNGATINTAPILKKIKTKILVVLFIFFSDLGAAAISFFSASTVSIFSSPFLLVIHL